jgi:hypothetical protein
VAVVAAAEATVAEVAATAAADTRSSAGASYAPNT